MLMMYPHTITIFNAYDDKGSISYYPTVIKNVLYQDKQAEKTGNTNHMTDNNGYVQIPYLNENSILQDTYIANTDFVKSSEWRLLPNKQFNWTIQENDFILKGQYSDLTPLNSRDMAKIKDTRTIISLEDIDYTSILSPHYGITLK